AADDDNHPTPTTKTTTGDVHRPRRATSKVVVQGLWRVRQRSHGWLEGETPVDAVVPLAEAALSRF
ncbi:MAG: hypothetical protein ACLFWR_08995, partial [Acidimicrobiales bacterium]